MEFEYMVDVPVPIYTNTYMRYWIVIGNVDDDWGSQQHRQFDVWQLTNVSIYLQLVSASRRSAVMSGYE